LRTGKGRRLYLSAVAMAALSLTLVVGCLAPGPTPDGNAPAEAPMEAVASTMTALVYRPTATPSATVTPKPTGTPTNTRMPTWTPSITPSATPTNTPVPTPDVPEGWLEHADITDKFTFWAPTWLTVHKQKAGETRLSGGRLLLTVSIVENPECVDYLDEDEKGFINCCVERAADGADRRGWDFQLTHKGPSDIGPHRAAVVDYTQTRELPDEEEELAIACAKEIYIPYPQTGQLVRVMVLAEDARAFSSAEESDIALIASSVRAEELRTPTVNPTHLAQTPTLAPGASRGEVITDQTLAALAVEATLTALAPLPTSAPQPEATTAEPATAIPPPAPAATSTLRPRSTPAQGTVTAESLNLRAGPGLDFAVLAIIHGGDTVQVAGRNEEGDWLLVTTSGGGRGWVGAKHIVHGSRLDDIPISATAEAPTGG